MDMKKIMETMMKSTLRLMPHNLIGVVSTRRQLLGNITKEGMVVQTIQRKLNPTPRLVPQNLGVVTTSLWRQLLGNITKKRMVVQTIQRKLKPTPRLRLVPQNLGVVTTSLWRQLLRNITKERMVI